MEPDKKIKKQVLTDTEIVDRMIETLDRQIQDWELEIALLRSKNEQAFLTLNSLKNMRAGTRE